MPPSRAETALREGMTAEEFVDYFLVDATPAMFSGDRFAYHAWRSSIAGLMEVDPAALHVVGSTCLGFSLNPDHLWAPVGTRSDIDVAVISAHHFDVAWRFLRRSNPRALRWSAAIRHSVRNHAPRDVYGGCIATDRILPILPFAEKWMKARTTARRHAAVAGRPVQFRLYRDLDGLRDYQLRSIRKAQDALNGA